MAVEMGRVEFERLVAEALDQIPPELAEHVRNVVVLVEDEPPVDEPDLLGLYDGVALTERSEFDPHGETALPDRIFVFRHPLLAMCETVEEVVEEVRVTVVHEVAHHFGIDDERLHGLGYA